VSGGVVVPGEAKPGQINVTQQQYDDLVVAQLTELWTDYGPLEEIWFDGGYVNPTEPMCRRFPHCCGGFTLFVTSTAACVASTRELTYFMSDIARDIVVAAAAAAAAVADSSLQRSRHSLQSRHTLSSFSSHSLHSLHFLINSLHSLHFPHCIHSLYSLHSLHSLHTPLSDTTQRSKQR
jgi:hypothetical protein